MSLLTQKANRPTNRVINQTEPYQEIDKGISKNGSANNFKRFARKTNNSYHQVIKTKPEWTKNELIRINNSPKNEQHINPQDRDKLQSSNYMKMTESTKTNLPKTITHKRFKNQTDDIDHVHNCAENYLTQSTSRATIDENAKRSTNLIPQSPKNNRLFFKSTAISSRLPKQSEGESELQDIRQIVRNPLKDTSTHTLSQDRLRQQYDHLQNQYGNYRKSNDEKMQRLRKEIEVLRNAYTQEQNKSLSSHKKLHEANIELQTLNRERNLIIGQLNKLSRAKLPRQYINIQSLKEVSLELQLNDVKSRLNESKTQIQKCLEEELKSYQLLTRKLQQEISRYEIANRMLLKRAQDAEKFKQSHKGCSADFKKLKQKYSQLLTQYHEIKKTNINLLKQNSARQKMLRTTCISPSKNTTNGNVTFSMPMSPSYQTKNLNLSMISQIANQRETLNQSKTHTTGDSEFSMEISLDFDTETENSMIYKRGQPNK